MFESLTSGLSSAINALRKKKTLTDNDVSTTMREIRICLLEADVALPVVNQLIESVQERAIGQKIIKSVEPGQQIVKIVHEEIVTLLGGDNNENNQEDPKTLLNQQPLNLNDTGPSVVLMLGLQGSGKTTTTGKLACWLQKQHKKRVLVASLDIRRPAAQQQLATLAAQNDFDSLPIIEGQDCLKIAERALSTAKTEQYDILLLDTAGRTVVDNELMDELEQTCQLANPQEILLVADSLTGQDAVNTATAFGQKVNLTGTILTRLDGDGRAGAVLSMRSVTNQPVKFIGVGEKIDQLDVFYPKRIADRILDMGDVVGLVERATQQIDEQEVSSMMERLQSGKFDYNDLLAQLKQIEKMGGMGGLMGFMPGMQKIKKQIDESGVDSNIFKQQQAVILSMTKYERSHPAVLNGARRKRVAQGAGVTVEMVNQLVKMLKQMRQMMGQIKNLEGKKGKKGSNGMLGGLFKSLMGGGSGMSLDKLKDMGSIADDKEIGGILNAQGGLQDKASMMKMMRGMSGKTVPGIGKLPFVGRKMRKQRPM